MERAQHAPISWARLHGTEQAKKEKAPRERGKARDGRQHVPGAADGQSVGTDGSWPLARRVSSKSRSHSFLSEWWSCSSLPASASAT